MDRAAFDAFTRRLATPGSRRAALGALAGTMLISPPVAARRQHRAKPDDPGVGATPPGHGGTPPGHGGTPPGQGGNPPGSGGCDPTPKLCSASAECCGGRICAQNGCATPDRPRCCAGIGQFCSGNSCECCGFDLDCVNNLCVYKPR